MPSPKDHVPSRFDKRDTEKIIRPAALAKPKTRSSPPNPRQDRFLQTLASKVDRDNNLRDTVDEAE